MASTVVAITWTHLAHLRIRNDVEKYVDGPLKCMGKLLLPSGVYLTEFKIAKSVSLKLALRLRSSPVSAILARIIRSLSSLVELQIPHYFSAQLDSLLNERIDTRSGKVHISSPDVLVQCLERLQMACKYLKDTIEYCTFAFGQSMMWLRLGHMNQHFLTLLASVSRLSILSKSLLVHACDLYKGLYLILDKLQGNSFGQKVPVKSVPQSMDHTLTALNLIPSEFPFGEKLKVETATASSSTSTVGGGDALEEEPVLVQRDIEGNCDTSSPSSLRDVTPPEKQVDSKLTPVKLIIPYTKRSRVTRRLSFTSPRMKRIFTAFKMAKSSTPKSNRKRKLLQ